MTLTLDHPTTAPTVPAPRSSDEDAALLEWVANLSHGVRSHALALSDMPTSHDDRRAAIGWTSVKGQGIIPDRQAALVIARWVRQGIDRWGGERNAWRSEIRQRWAARRGSLDARLYRRMCKELGGVARDKAGNGTAHVFGALYPNPLTERCLRRVRLCLELVPDRIECDSYGSEDIAGEVFTTEHLDDLEHFAASIEGLELKRVGSTWHMTLNGRVLTLPEFRNLDVRL